MNTCIHCGSHIRYSDIDPNTPWVHIHSHNTFCDVTDTASAVGSTWANEFANLRTIATPQEDKDYAEARP